MTTALLLSGGMESTALAYWKRPELAYTIDYGHASAKAEVLAASRVCEDIGIKHAIIVVNLSGLGAGLLAGRSRTALSKNEEWWPFRNQMLLTIAGMHAVQEGVEKLLIGTVLSDARHADGKPRFVEGINTVMSQQEGRLKVSAPALRMTAEQLLRRSKTPPAIILRTFSCHRGNEHCCHCPGCKKRAESLARMGLFDGLLSIIG